MASLSRGGVVWLAAAVALAGVMAWSPVSSEDIGWHLKTGEWILEHGWPASDPFSHTLAAGTRWNDTPWLYEVAASVLRRVGGWNALVALQILFAVGWAGALWWWLHGRGEAGEETGGEEVRRPPDTMRLRGRGEMGAVGFATVALILAAAYYRSWVRAEMVSYIILTLHLGWWGWYFRTGRLPAVRLLATQWVWSNAHSACVLGIVVAGCAVGAVALGLLWRGGNGEQRPQAKVLALPVVLVMLLVAVAALNPYGWRHLVYGLRESSAAPVIELLPPSLYFLLGPPGSCLLLAILGVRGMARREERFAWIVAAVFLVPAARYVRFFPFLAIALAPFVASGWRALLGAAAMESGGIEAKSGESRGAIGVRRLALGAAFLGLNLAVAQFNDPRRLFHGGFDDAAYPVAAATFIAREDLQGNMYNDFDVGGYLIWRLGPERKVFVDNRTDLYGPLLGRLRSLGSAEGFRGLLDKYGCTYALVPYDAGNADPGSRTQIETLANWRDWVLVFWDDYGALFVRDGPENHRVIERNAFRAIEPEWLPSPGNERTDWGWLEGLSRDPERSGEARKELERAAGASARNVRARLGLAWFHAFRQEWAEARKAFDQVERSEPECFAAQAGVAITAFAQGDGETAREALAAARRLAGSGTDARFLARIEGIMGVREGGERKEQKDEKDSKDLKEQ